MIHHPISFRDYKALPGMSQSLLKHIERSPAHLGWALSHPKKPTKEMQIGSLTDHLFFGTEYAYEVGPWDDYKTKDAQTWRKQNEEAGIASFLRKEVTEVEEMLGSIRMHPEVTTLMSSGRSQVALTGVWRDGDLEVEMKALIDWVPDEYLSICDLKTTDDASPAEFGRHVCNMAYDAQAAYYRDLWKQNFEEDVQFCWIVGERDAPYGSAVYRATDECLARGREIYCRRLKRWALAQREPGGLPCYPITVTDIELPTWALPKERS